MSKIAVIVPIYNVEPYLNECIASITAQSYADLVIILVNDASTDKSLDIAKSFAQKDERIIIIDKENSGISATRNAALEILYSACDDKQNSSLGGGCIYFILKETKTNLNEFKIQFTNQPLNSNEWKLFTKTQNPLQATKNVEFIAFVDSDDIINPHAYERVVVPMQEDESVDCVIFGAKAFGEVSRQEKLEKINKYHKIKRNGKVEMNESIVVETDNSSATKLFRLKLLQRHKIYFPPTKIGEDEVFKFNYLPLCKNVYFIDEIFYLYRQRKDSTMSVFRWNLTNSVVNIDTLYNFKYIADFYQKNGLFDEKFNLLCKIYVSLVKSVWSMNARKNSKEILNIALNFGQKYFTNIHTLNQLRQKFKFGNDILGHSKEILCVELLGEIISTKRRRYFLHFFKRKFKIHTTIYTSNNKISYIKFGRTKLITRKKGI